jgi:hypothetical protein
MSLAYDKFGTLFVTNYTAGTISKVASDGSVTPFVSGLGGPMGMAFDGNGDLFVGNNTHNENASIWKITPDGTKSLFVPNGLLNPYDLAFDPNGNLYVAAAADGVGVAGRIYKITPQGAVSNFVTNLANPLGLAVPGVILPVPEPTSLALLGVGAGALLRRRARPNGVERIHST